MKKIIGIIFLLIITLLFSGVVRVNAQDMTLQNSIVDMGTYTVTEPVMTTVKVYIDEDMVSFIESTGATVYTIEVKHFLFGIIPLPSTYKYYHYVHKYVDEIVTERTLYNDIDSLIFILNELDNFAHEYSGCDGNELNCVLGFVRSTSNEYANTSQAYGGKWGALAGSVNEDFIAYVDDHDGYALEISEYFSAFIPTNSNDTLYDKALFNEALHGDAYSKYEFLNGLEYDNNGLKQYKLVDPFNVNSYIDLIHLFASLDGIYNNTGNSLTFGNSHNRDIVSWGGDLQQMGDIMRNVNVDYLPTYYDIASGYSNINIDFCSFVGYSNCGFSEDDLLADVDAMNIAITYLDNDVNDTVSVAFSSYYNLINYDDSYLPNRYKMFLKTVIDTIELDNHGVSDIEKFKQEVYFNMDVLPDNNSYKNYYIILGSTYVGYGLLRGSAWPLAGELPDVELRGYLADLFIDYICNMASRPYYYR